MIQNENSYVNERNNNMKKLIKGFSFVATFTLFNIWTLMAYYSAMLPDSYYIASGDKLSLNTVIEIEAQVQEKAVQSVKSEALPLSQTATLKLFGVIPVKDVELLEVETPVLIPGGNPFGIKLLMEGVMVVGMGEIECSGGRICPATEAGIKQGDVITSIDGKKVNSNNELQEIISESDGNSVNVQINRDGRDITFELQPVFSEYSRTYQVGMWVRDSTAGIGTMTFHEPSSGSFGGLGHPICDIDTGGVIPISSGEIVNVQINNVKKGYEGIPGELQGSFISGDAIGILSKNNEYGVFGNLFTQSDTSKAMPMGLKQDVEVGEATILTTVEGTIPKEYNISIEKIDYRNNDTAKNMIIRITDEELLDKTGGIVQGMSGSPIIQNGKLVGAVTHVFVNDPAKGYGVFTENMYELGL
ncbi:MAG: SpoIVB peptidase [Clostridiales bacterium]|nr:SpoIVB peptidase [Clostridiales bacterium]